MVTVNAEPSSDLMCFLSCAVPCIACFPVMVAGMYNYVMYVALEPQA